MYDAGLHSLMLVGLSVRIRYLSIYVCVCMSVYACINMHAGITLFPIPSPNSKPDVRMCVYTYAYMCPCAYICVYTHMHV